MLSTLGAGIEPRLERLVDSMTNGHWIQSNVPVKVLKLKGITRDL